MSNKFKDISIRNHTYYLFDDINNIKNFDQNNIKNLKIYAKIFLLRISDMWGSKIHIM